MHSLTRREGLCETRFASFKGCSACRNFSKKDFACEDGSPSCGFFQVVGGSCNAFAFFALLLCSGYVGLDYYLVVEAST